MAVCLSRPRSSSFLRLPLRIATSGVHLVADVNNHRVVMLGPRLEYVRDLVTDVDGPERLAFDDVNGLLYVADNKFTNGRYSTGQVKVFRL